MRISDCSSDVCSSDLRRTFALPKRDGASRGSGPIQASWSKLKMSLVPARTVARRASKRPHRLRCRSNSAASDRLGSPSRTQIGSESSRERVCQSVYTPVVAESLKNKQNNQTKEIHQDIKN